MQTQNKNKEEDWGYLYGYQTRESEIGVNIEKLWKDTIGRGKQRELNFIDNFSKIMTHEELHREIFYVILELFEPKEELIVDEMAKSNRLKVKT